MDFYYTTDLGVAEQFKAALDTACGYDNPEVQAKTLTYRAVELIAGPDEDQWLVPLPDAITAHGENAPTLNPRTILPEDRQSEEAISEVETAASTAAFHQQAANNRVQLIDPETGDPIPLPPDPNNFTIITENVAREFGFFPDDSSEVEPPSGGGGPIKGGL